MAVKKNFEGKYYRVSLFLGYDDKGKRKYKYFYGEGMRDAERKRDAYKADLSAGLSDYNPTLRESLQDWLFEVIKPSGIKDSTFARYYDHYNTLKETDLIHTRVKNISAMAVQKILNSMAEQQSYNYVSLIRKFLNRHMTYLEGVKIIHSNPLKGVSMPQKVKEKRNQQKFDYNPYTSAEKSLILLYLEQKHPTYWVVTSLLFKLGAREGEILGLRVGDLKGDELSIDSSLSWVKVIDRDGSYHYEYQNDSTKNAASTRVIYVDEEVQTLIRKASTIKAKYKLKLGASFINNDLMFVNETGTPIDATSYRKYIRRVQKKLGLPEKTVHMMRHTFVTEMYEKGIDEMTVQEIIGHTKGSNITRMVYSHLRKETKKERMLAAIK